MVSSVKCCKIWIYDTIWHVRFTREVHMFHCESSSCKLMLLCHRGVSASRDWTVEENQCHGRSVPWGMAMLGCHQPRLYYNITYYIKFVLPLLGCPMYVPPSAVHAAKQTTRFWYHGPSAWFVAQHRLTRLRLPSPSAQLFLAYSRWDSVVVP